MFRGKHDSLAPAHDPTEESGRERSESPDSGVGSRAGIDARPGVPILVIADPEVPEKARRRRFTAEYKLRVVEQADACTEAGEVGELLRREGLYSSHLATWRRQKREGSLQGLSPRRRGRKPNPVNPLAKRVAELERENKALSARLRQAEVIIDVQKKVSQILGIPLATRDDSENGS